MYYGWRRIPAVPLYMEEKGALFRRVLLLGDMRKEEEITIKIYRENDMCVAVIGGMDRLERDYENEAGKHGVDLRVFTKSKVDLAARLRKVDAVVVFTGKTSHRIRNEAISTAKTKGIPVILNHSCGVCSLRECLQRLTSGSCRASDQILCCAGRCTASAPGRRNDKGGVKGD